MFDGARRLLVPAEQPAGYEPIAGEERDAEAVPVVPPESSRRVYLSFWVLGAAVLLPWNGG